MTANADLVEAIEKALPYVDGYSMRTNSKSDAKDATDAYYALQEVLAKIKVKPPMPDDVLQLISLIKAELAIHATLNDGIKEPALTRRESHPLIKLNLPQTRTLIREVESKYGR